MPDPADLEEDTPSPSREEMVDEIIEYKQGILRLEDEIDLALSEAIDENEDPKDFSEVFSNLMFALTEEFDESVADDISEMLINLIVSIDRNIVDVFESKEEKELLKLIKKYQYKFGYDLRRKNSRVHQGVNYWSNVSSNLGYRRNSPYIEHEFTIDHTEVRKISGGLRSNANLLVHITENFRDLSGTLGPGSLDEVPVDLIDEALDNLQDFKEKLDENEDNEDESISNDE